MPASTRLSPLLSSLLCVAAAAQVPPGYAVVAWKPQSGIGGLKLVDRTGAGTDIQGLDPETLGTTEFDGARSVLVGDGGMLYAGLGLDNRTVRTPRPLVIRQIALNGSTAVSDQPFATVMMVPAGELWHVSDLKERPDGTLLVGATETVFTANPMPQTAAFLVDPRGNVTALPTNAFPAGSLAAVATHGDRWVGAFVQSFFVVNVELVSFPLFPGGQAPFQVTQFVNVSGFGGIEFDADGSLIACVGTRNGSIARVPHAPNATPVWVHGAPADVIAADAIPASGLAAVFALPRNPQSPLLLVDTLAGTSTTWSPGVATEPVDIAVRRNPTLYGTGTSVSSPGPFLGSFGGLPTAGNSQFGFRVGGAPGSLGALLAGFGRGNVPTPFGVLLLDPTRPIVVLANFSVPNGGVANLPLPLPAGIRGTVDLQAVLLPSVNPPGSETTSGLELTIQ
ncbi:MAG TPA: hypothetical protein VK081_02605 [Planctomycetota bacterium]|nr:hypothetical protein [Planctomycetota bacterium]